MKRLVLVACTLAKDAGFMPGLQGAKGMTDGSIPVAAYPPPGMQTPVHYPTPTPPYRPHPQPQKPAQPIEVSEPVYQCPKAGFILDGEVCRSTITAPSAYACEPGYKQIGEICVSTTELNRRCSSGEYSNGQCVCYAYTDPEFKCPAGSEDSRDGRCSIIDYVDEVEACPRGSHRRSGGRCVTVRYEAAEEVCPPEYEERNGRCIKEVEVNKKAAKNFKGRLLQEFEDQSDDEDYSDDEITTEYIDYYTLQGDTTENTNELMCAPDGTCMPSAPTYPSYPPPQYPQYGGQGKGAKAPKTKKFKGDSANDVEYHQEIVWQKMKVPVPVMVPTQNRSKGRTESAKPEKSKTVKSSSPKVIYEKPPKTVIKVISQAPERFCDDGILRSGRCLIEEDVPAETKCPVALINGECARRKYVKPSATCPTNTSLVCPNNRTDSPACRCESSTSTPVDEQCPDGYTLVDGHCERQTTPSLMCPYGYTLSQTDNSLCAKEIVEPALCTFTVSYLCPDCGDDNSHHHVAVPYNVAPIMSTPSKKSFKGSYLMAEV